MELETAIFWLTCVTAATAIVAVLTTISANRRSREANDRMNGLTGALETHSQLMLRLDAEAKGKKVIWWDPINPATGEKERPYQPKHGESAVIDTAYIYLPVELRGHRTAEWDA